jgi:superfamily I DNA/RNA helicase
MNTRKLSTNNLRYLNWHESGLKPEVSDLDLKRQWKMPYQPTQEQTAILRHDHHRHARVLAGPGTGKSATLVALLDQLVAQDPAPRIKLLTFTGAATAELVKKVSDHPAAASERPSTVHSFSISVLLQNPGTGGFPEPLRIADKWEDANVVHPALARRIGVRVTRLENLIREMAANWSLGRASPNLWLHLARRAPLRASPCIARSPGPCRRRLRSPDR